MAGFDNDCVYADNADFSTAAAGGGSSANGLATNGQLWIGTAAVNAGGTHINVGTITSPLGTLSIGYSSPNITIDTAGGGVSVDSFAMQTGTSPVIPTAAGLVTFSGGVVAAGTNPVRTDGTGANTMVLEVQTSQALAAADATKIGLANFDSASFAVAATGFVTASGTGLGKTITGNTGGALSPTAGNWNIPGNNNAQNGFATYTTGSGSTLTINSYGTAKWVVNPTAGIGTHTTIASAITSAASGETIFITPGTYTENLTLKAGVDLTAFGCDSSYNGTGHVIISGTCTLTTAGTVVISGIQLQTNSAALLAVTGSAASVINLTNCYLNCTNNSGITLSSSGGAQVIIKNCAGNLGTTGIKLFDITNTGVLEIVNTKISNTGGSSTASTNSAGLLVYSFCDFTFPTTISSTGTIGMGYTSIDTASQNVTAITLGGGTQICKSCSFVSGSASAVSIGSSAKLENCFINSSNTNAITGAGTLSYPGLMFDGTSSLINTTTQTLNKQLLGSRQVVLPAGDYTVLNSDYFIGASSSAARAITLPASPATGQIHIIKDITPNATTFNITISGNGNNILGQTSASTYVISVNGGSITLVYDGVVWCVV